MHREWAGSGPTGSAQMGLRHSPALCLIRLSSWLHERVPPHLLKGLEGPRCRDPCSLPIWVNYCHVKKLLEKPYKDHDYVYLVKHD